MNPFLATAVDTSLAERTAPALTLEAWTLFAFERDMEGSLRRFPMVVRFKLDECALRISLEDWQRLKREERVLLAAHAVGTAADRVSYRRVLDSMMLARCGKLARRDVPDVLPEWSILDTVPKRIAEQCQEAGAPQLDLVSWQALPAVARFSLYALSRPGHRNRGFPELVLELLAGHDLDA